MPNENGTQTIDADEKQTVALVDHETPGSPSKQRPGKHSTPHRKTVLAISAAMVVAVAGGYFAWNAFRYEDTDDAQIDGHVMQLSTRINGQIKDVYVVEGQLVHAGDALVTVDPQDYKIAEAQAQANLADAEATAASSHWKVPITSVTVQSNLDSAKTGVINAEAAVRCSLSRTTNLPKQRWSRPRLTPQRAMQTSNGTSSSSRKKTSLASNTIKRLPPQQQIEPQSFRHRRA